ncbi:MAG: ASKHA domain-containing protein [Treponema sp.]|jgi:uncharacterized 2Fe-2S/4Fe-4S cluster protein (DUF4445 family)|nr:ASKHA domain-containing protein [Treponema sp.]
MLHITVQGRGSCESRPGDTILEALIRAALPGAALTGNGIILSAPCGGRGICGKCRITLLKGTVELRDTKVIPKPGDSFSACRGTTLSDITIELPEEEIIAETITDLSADTKPKRIEKPGRKKVLHAGIGVDIGTTTVQAELIDLGSGKSLETITALNDQRSFGADVMSRINAARNGQSGELSAVLNRQIEGILQHCLYKWNLSGIEQATISGNTTMLHFFCGADPSGMGVVPFTPVFLEERHFPGKELNLSVGQIGVLPGISAFVGADIVSGLAFLDILNRKKDSLLVDIGTNGEIALWKKAEQRLLCCSTAAGPCFAGAEISCGMGALPGAINRISINDKPVSAGNIFNCGPLVYSTLGNSMPRGICGAGLIDAIAALKQLSVIDETGALTDEYIETGFPLAEGLTISQKDIRRFQLAKSAICSGITVLCKRAGLNPAKLDAVYIAGGLGFYIDIKNAVATGLLPPEFTETLPGKIAVCGNLSLKGAVQSLIESAFLQRCKKIIAHSNIVELAADADFSEAFTENMLFP